VCCSLLRDSFWSLLAHHINDFFRAARKAKIARHEHARWIERPFAH